jgi:hypothetical protein
MGYLTHCVLRDIALTLVINKFTQLFLGPWLNALTPLGSVHHFLICSLSLIINLTPFGIFCVYWSIFYGNTTLIYAVFIYAHFFTNKLGHQIKAGCVPYLLGLVWRHICITHRSSKRTSAFTFSGIMFIFIIYVVHYMCPVDLILYDLTIQ